MSLNTWYLWALAFRMRVFSVEQLFAESTWCGRKPVSNLGSFLLSSPFNCMTLWYAWVNQLTMTLRMLWPKMKLGPELKSFNLFQHKLPITYKISSWELGELPCSLMNLIPHCRVAYIMSFMSGSPAGKLNPTCLKKVSCCSKLSLLELRMSFWILLNLGCNDLLK